MSEESVLRIRPKERDRLKRKVEPFWLRPPEVRQTPLNLMVVHSSCLILCFKINVVCRRKGFRIRLSWI